VTPGRELTCREFVELVTDYLEERMAPAERDRFEAHLAICPGCQAYLDQMRETIAALGRLTEERLSPDARDALLAAFRGWHSGR
jgi:anti-sigma factor RsiW